MKKNKDNKKNKSEDGSGKVNQEGSEGAGDDVAINTLPNEDSKDGLKYFNTNTAGGYVELSRHAQRLLDSMDTSTRIHYLEDLYNENLVYRVEIEGEGTKFFRSSYSVSDNNQVSLEGEPVEVVEKREYVEVNNSGQTNNNNEGGVTVDKREEKIKGIIANEKLPFTEDNRQCLDNFTEEQLDHITKQGEDKPTGNSEGGEVTKDQAIEILKEQLQNREQFLQLLPEKERQVFAHSLKLHEEQEQKAIKAITENSDFTEDDLKGKDLGELQKLANAIQPKANFAPMGGGETTTNVSYANAEEPEPLLPAGVVVNDENKSE